MKRITALLLALCLLLCMAACGEDATTDPAPDGTNATSQNPTTGENPTKAPTQAPTQAPTEPPEVALAGKYLIYHIAAGDNELNYFQISMSRLAGTCIQLNTDGTVEGVMNGSEIPAGTTWDAKTMTMTNGEGATNAITIADNALVFATESGAMTFLKEGDPRLDDLPTPYQYLYDYIVANGTQDDRGHTVACDDKEDRETTMTATADGGILWKYQEEDCTLEMQLVENAATQSLVMYIQKGLMDNDYTCNATIETAVITKWDIPFASFEQTPDTSIWVGPNFYEGSTESSLRLMLVDIWAYLALEVGITMESLGFTAYNS